MATKKPIIPLTMKVRSASTSMDYQGAISQGLELLFLQLHGKPKTRAALLDKLLESHREMLVREAERAATEAGNV